MPKKIAFVIAQQGFRDEEYFIPKQALEGKGISVTTVSLEKGPALGKLGGAATADISIRDLKPSEYDGIFFIGGPGAQIYFNDKKAHDILGKAQGMNKLIGGICAGPATLAYAGLLKGKKATSFLGVSDILKTHGALYTGSPSEVDGRIITADGPSSAEKFADAIAQALLDPEN